MSDPLSKMDNRELRELMLALRAHALMRLRLRSRSIDLADDFAQTAILKAKSTRAYDPGKWSYCDFLKSIIDSVIYHHYHAAGHTQIIVGDEDALTNFTDGKFSPEDELSYLQQESDMLTYISTRSQSCYMIAVWMVKGGVRNPARISELTGLDIKKVYARIKHLKSIVQKWREISNKYDRASSTDRAVEGKE